MTRTHYPKRKTTSLLVAGALAVLFGGCGGGGGSEPPPGPTPQTLSGTAAIGRPLARSPIYLKDARGAMKSAYTDDDGKFSFDVTGLTAPFILRSQDEGLYSYAGEAGTTNLTPFTTLITGIAAGDDPQKVYDTPRSLNIDQAMQALRDLLKPALKQLGVAETVDLMRTAFDANGTGLDAVIDAIRIPPPPSNSNVLTVTNAFTGAVVATATVNGANDVTVTDPIDASEAATMPSGGLTKKKYFVYVDPDGSGPELSMGPFMLDLTEDAQGRVSGAIVVVEGDTGDMKSVPLGGTRTGTALQLTTQAIACSNTQATNNDGTVVLELTLDAAGNLAGVLKQFLPTGDTCEGMPQNSDGSYSFTFTGEDVTSASPANLAGTYDIYATPHGNYPEQGPATLRLQQNGSGVEATLEFTDDTGQKRTVSGTGAVYGAYGILRLPVIICSDTCLPNGTCPEAENATFFGRFDNGSVAGWFGDGVPPGDRCKATYHDQSPNPQTTDAQGVWRAVKK